MKYGRRERKKILDQIRKHDDPMLSTVCTLQDGKDRMSLIRLMKIALLATANGNGDGVGIAAPKLGINDRVIVVHRVYTPWPKMPYAMINPHFIPQGECDLMQKEGCLSYPGITTQVLRYNTINVRWTDEKGDSKLRAFSGYPSRVIQHEIDHLNGKCEVGDEWRDSQLDKS